MTAFDEDALHATADLVGRCGARELQIGYLHDNVPTEQADWYAHAQLRGARITAEHHRGPVEAADALARRILDGAKCTHCQCLITLSDSGQMAYDQTMADGTTWTKEQQAAAGLCRWRRNGPRWVRSCEATP